MNEKSSFDVSEFESRISGSSDEEVMAILKKRKQYLPDAAEIAIKEAVKRELINSEQDLLSEEFEEEPGGFHLFPIIEKKENRKKISKSILRTFLLAGLIPMIWGWIGINRSDISEGIFLILLGAVWIYVSYKLMQKVNPKLLSFLFFMIAAGSVYLTKLFIGRSTLKILDVFVPAVLILFLIYGILFLKRLKD